MGQPLERELGVCLAALELADRFDCSAEDCSQAYYVALLMHLGCTGGASFFASWVGGDEINFHRGASIVSPASEPLEDIRRCLQLPHGVGEALGQITERWDGKGVPGEVAGEKIARPLRIVRVVLADPEALGAEWDLGQARLAERR